MEMEKHKNFFERNTEEDFFLELNTNLFLFGKYTNQDI